MAEATTVLKYDRYSHRVILISLAVFFTAAVIHDSVALWLAIPIAVVVMLGVIWALTAPRNRVDVDGSTILVCEKYWFKEVVHRFDASEVAPKTGIVEIEGEGSEATLYVELLDGRRVFVASAVSNKRILKKEQLLRALWRAGPQDLIGMK